MYTTYKLVYSSTIIILVDNNILLFILRGVFLLAYITIVSELYFNRNECNAMAM